MDNTYSDPTNQTNLDNPIEPEKNIPTKTPMGSSLSYIIKSMGGGKAISALFGMLLLAGGVGAGIILVTQPQLLNQQAAVISYTTCANDVDCSPGYKCTNKICVDSVVINNTNPVDGAPCGYNEAGTWHIVGSSSICTYGGLLTCDGVVGSGGDPCRLSDGTSDCAAAHMIRCQCGPNAYVGAAEGSNCTQVCGDIGVTCNINVCQPSTGIIIEGPNPTSVPATSPSPTPTASPSPTPTASPSPTPTPLVCVPPVPKDPPVAYCAPSGSTGSAKWEWPVDTSANEYEVDIYNANGTIYIDNGWLSYTNFNCTSGMCSYLTNNMPLGSYYSRVRSRNFPNGCSVSAWSQSRTITINSCPTPTPTPIVAQCVSTNMYTPAWSPITVADFYNLPVGGQVYFCTLGSTNGLTFDKARFTINGVLRPEVTLKRPNGTEFCDLYTIPANTYSFTVQGEIHHTTLGWQ